MSLRRRFLAPALAAAVALAAALAPGAPAEADPSKYVALGDSYAAGPLIPVMEQPWGCLKSTNNYPKLLAKRLGLSLLDATCSGAQTDDMWHPQGVSPTPNPAQFDRLAADTALVTLQIGGNDIGFGSIAEACGSAAVQRQSCRSQFTNPDGSDELERRIAETLPKVVEVVDGIHARSPLADVYLLGYPSIFRIGAVASCPAMGVGEADAQYLRGVQEKLNAMIAEAAATAGATYLDVYGPSAGRTACDLPALRWVEPLVPVNAAAPIHPNLNGMLGVSDLLERAVVGGADPSTDVELPAGLGGLVPAVPSPF
jgi:lysophospholipase L1-like esterase